MTRKVHAVLVGVTIGEHATLSAADGVRRSRNFLAGRFGTSGNIVPLTEDNARKCKMKIAITDAYKSARQGDLFVLQFSGHGDSRGGQEWVLPDENVTDVELVDWIVPFNMNGVEVFVVSDCCYGRGMKDPGRIAGRCSLTQFLATTCGGRFSQWVLRSMLDEQLAEWRDKLFRKGTTVGKDAARMVLAASATGSLNPTNTTNRFIKRLCTAVPRSATYGRVRRKMRPIPLHDVWTVDGNPDTELSVPPLAV